MSEQQPQTTMVVVAYRPLPGKEGELLELTRSHVPRLRALGFATERPAMAGLAADGTVVEVFEWAAGAIARAHEHPEVLAMWAEYAQVCTYTPLQELAEATMLFASFTPIEL